MHHYYKKAGVLLLAAGLCSCSPAKKTTTSARKMDQVHWLLGQWQRRLPQALLVEKWEQKNDSLFTGKSYVIKGSDTTVLETIRLEQQKEELFYIPTVPRQNKGQPVTFTLTKFTEKQMTFENPEHDFPQKITYTLVTPDSLLAEISGSYKGKERKQQFPMHKVK